MGFWHFSDRSANTVALVDPAGSAITYGELDTRVAQAEAGLRKIGVRQLGFLLMGNDLASVVSYLACLRAGHVPLLLARDTQPARIDVLAQVYAPCWVMGANLNGEPVGGVGLPLKVRKTEHPSTLHPALSLLLGTSGTTGSPKLVRLAASALQANATSIAQYMQLNALERAMTVLPPHYSYGLSVINSHLASGASLLLSEASVISPDFNRLVRLHSVTSLSGVPYTYQMLARTGFLQQDFPSLRTLTQAGGRLDERLTRSFAQWAIERGVRFVVMYGQTEATARISYVPPPLLLNKIGSIGQPIPDGRLDVDESGELVYHGANVMLGYAQSREDLSLGDELQGRLCTGDLGRRDDDGFFYVVGRLKRFVKLAGNRVSLDDVESMLARHILCAVAATGTDDRLTVHLESNAADVLDMAKRLLMSEFGVHHSMSRLLLMERLPRVASGKTDYTALATLNTST